jgi:queuosine precursor transporter
METESRKFNKELSLYIILSGFFLVNALLAEVIGVKFFSLEKVLGIRPANIPFFGGQHLNLDMSVGILIWPFVFIVSDIINEYFGKPGVKRLSFLAAILIGYCFLIILGSTKLSPAQFWLDNNSIDLHGRPFDADFAYSNIFRQGMGIIVGSITAFLVGQLVDIYTFHFFRKLTGHKKLWLRATGSTVISQIVDSFLVLFIAFYFLGNWTFIQVISVAIVQYIYKISLAIGLTPVIYWMHSVIDRFLGRSLSDEMLKKAEEKVQEINV